MTNPNGYEVPNYTLRSSLRYALGRTKHRLHYVLSKKSAKRTKPQMVKVHGVESSELSGRVCIFSHYDKQKHIDPRVLNYLAELKKLGFKIIVISTSTSLDSELIENSRECCDCLFIKENIGFDFGSWKAGLGELDLDFTRFELLLLANDSVYGPLNSLEPIIEKMQNNSYDLFGITDSLQLRFHLQSYFLLFSAAAVNGQTFQNYWRNLPYLSSKKATIWAGETGLTQTMLKAGFKIGAYIEYQKVRREHEEFVRGLEFCNSFPEPLNVCQELWKMLITEYGFPFIKVELLRDNPHNVPDVSDWKYIVEQNSEYQSCLIQDHLDSLKAVKLTE